MTAPTILLGFTSYADSSFELIVRDDQGGIETTLAGKLDPGQLEIIGCILPTCVFAEAKMGVPDGR